MCLLSSQYVSFQKRTLKITSPQLFSNIHDKETKSLTRHKQSFIRIWDFIRELPKWQKNMMAWAKFCKRAEIMITLVILCALFQSSTAFSEDHFVAAVYEHPRQGDWTSLSPSEIVQINLEYYKNATKVAKEYGADLILFPEYGIFAPRERKELKPYLEVIPNPKQEHATPCDEANAYSQRPILYSLSCIAKANNIVVVANMGGIEYCSKESNCSEDGTLHQNANVAFDQNGTLIGRYYKEHLYFEFGMNLPREIQDPTFKTNFGKFATFICFDIIFEHMADIYQSEDIDAVLYSAMWVNSSPFYISTQWWESWATGSNATLLASNIQIPGYFSTGSGIYSGRVGTIASTLNPDGIPKLVIATVPKRNKAILSKSNVIAFFKNGTKEWKDDGKDVPLTCSYNLLGESRDIFKDYRCYNEDLSNYTLIKLNKTKDHLTACNNGMCCELEYTASSMTESFYFGVYNGIHIPYLRYPWAEENCFLARCNDVNGEICSEFPMISKTLFQTVSMAANFTSKHIYPSMLSSKMRLVPVKNWSYEKKENIACVDFNNSRGLPLLAATLKGRDFDRDPPYQQ